MYATERSPQMNVIGLPHPRSPAGLPSPEPTSVVIVDGTALFREGMREIIGQAADLRVAGEAGDGAGAVAAVEHHRPDVVLLDAGSDPNDTDDAVALVSRLLEIDPSLRIVALSVVDDLQYAEDLFAAGASAYLLKSVTRAELLHAVRAVRVDDRLILTISRSGLARPRRRPAEVLTGREVEILELVAQARSNFQIATRLNIAEGTVKRHMRNIFAKLSAVSRLDAVNKASALNLVALR